MKILFRRICISLIILTLFLTSFSAANNSFTDVATDAWYSDAITYVVEKGMMCGTSNRSFAPDTIATRAMVVTVLWRHVGQPDYICYGTTYPDVIPGEWYSIATEWAYFNDVMVGFPIPFNPSEDAPSGFGATFGPDDPMSREQLATVLFRYAKLKGLDVSAKTELQRFPDYAKVSNWAYEAMQWCVSEGLIQGNVIGGVTMLDPHGNTTRAQLACILMRFLENTKS